MTLDPQVDSMLRRLPPHTELALRTVDELRAGYAETVRLRRGDRWEPTAVASTTDLSVADVPCRLHLPPEPAADPAPLLLWFHGGGWVVGGLDSHDDICRMLSARSGFAVLQVDYRLSPEHPYPAGLEDCLAVLRDVSGSERWGSVSVGGDSAGGNLAAAVALVCRSEGRPLAGMVLAYPCLDASCSSASYQELASGYGLEAEDMRWYWQQYAATAERGDPLLSPAACADLHDLPPTVLFTAEYDVLRDEGDAFAERLAGDGVTIHHRRLPGQVHGFLGAAALVDAADAGLSEMATAARDLFT